MATSLPSEESRAATLTVSPHRSKLNFVRPTTPPTTGPMWMPARIRQPLESACAADHHVAGAADRRHDRVGVRSQQVGGRHKCVADRLDLLHVVPIGESLEGLG